MKCSCCSACFNYILNWRSKEMFSPAQFSKKHWAALGFCRHVDHTLIMQGFQGMILRIFFLVCMPLPSLKFFIKDVYKSMENWKCLLPFVFALPVYKMKQGDKASSLSMQWVEDSVYYLWNKAMYANTYWLYPPVNSSFVISPISVSWPISWIKPG